MLLLAAVLAVAGTYYAIIHAKGSARGAESVAHAASPSGSDPAVIRFVKDPEPAPPFQARDISGNALSAADWKGKVVLLNFWATWCEPCRQELPELISLQTQYKDRLQIIGISEDDDPPAKVLQFAQRQGINYPIVMATSELTDAYGGVPALPTSFVIDTQGRVVQRHTGIYSVDAYNREFRSLLGLPTDARIETFEDTGQVLLKNAANASELPGVSFDGLTPEQKKVALHRMNAEGCTCGCKLTIAQCRINDDTCATSKGLAAEVVKEVAGGGAKRPASPSEAAKPAGN